MRSGITIGMTWSSGGRRVDAFRACFGDERADYQSALGE